MKKIILLSFFLTISFSTFAKQKVVITSLTEAKTKIEKHFDLDDDGYLNQYERLHVRTYQHFKYPLVEKRKQKPYDINKNRMLEPFEEQKYLEDKKAGRLSKTYREYKKNQKEWEKAREKSYEYKEDTIRYLEKQFKK